MIPSINVRLLMLLLFLKSSGIVIAQGKQPNAEMKLKELGINLITPTAPTANFLKAHRIGNACISFRPRTR